MAGHTSSVSVTAMVRKAGTRPTLRMQIIRFVIAVLGCYGSVFTVLSSLDTGVNNAVVFTLIIGLCFVLTALRLKESIVYSTLALSSSAAIAAAAIFRNAFCAGLADFLNIYTSTAWEEYRDKPFIPIAEPELADKHMTVFVLLSVSFICFVSCYLFIRCDLGCYAALLLLCPAVPMLMIGREPCIPAFIALIAATAGLIVLEYTSTNSVRGHQFVRYGIQCAAMVTATVIVCLALVSGIAKVMDYKRPKAVDDIFFKADDYISNGELENDILDTFSQLAGYSRFYGAVNHGRLDEFGKIRFEFKDVLQVTMPRSEDTVYLRGFVGSVYTGRSWEELPNSKLRELEEITKNFSTDGLSSLLMDSYNLKSIPADLPDYSFTVKNIAANRDYMYIPYNVVPESVSGYDIVNNSYFSGSLDTYFGRAFDPDGYYGYQNLFRKRWSIPSSLVSDEAAYRKFVYENYLELPDTFSPEEIFTQSYYEYITAEEIQTGKSTLDEMTVFSRKLYYIKDWLRSNCEYSLTTEPLPKGDDFVNHFLKYRKGSCSHFASAALLMCRYAGIPARYVEGYVISPHDTDMSVEPGSVITVNVQDTNGHAWVEVYIDGYGWYPMEFTSGYGNVRTAFPTETIASETETAPVTEPYPETTSVPYEDSDGNTASQQQDIVNETTAVQTNPEAAATIPAPPHTELASPDTYTTAHDSIGFSIFGIEGNKRVDVVYNITWLLILVMVISAITCIILLRRHIIISRYNSLSSPSLQVRYDYMRFCRLLRIMNMPEQGELSYSEFCSMLARNSPLLADANASQIVSLALKSSFGGNTVTHDEAHEMRIAVTSLAKRHYQSLSAFGKFSFRFLYCII